MSLEQIRENYYRLEDEFTKLKDLMRKRPATERPKDGEVVLMRLRKKGKLVVCEYAHNQFQTSMNCWKDSEVDGYWPISHLIGEEENRND